MAKSDAILQIDGISYTIEQAAAALGMNRVQVGGLVRLGRIPHVLIGERVLIGKRALEQWLTDECLASVVSSRVEPTPMRTVRHNAKAQR